MTDNFKEIKNYVQKCLYKFPKINNTYNNYMVIELVRRGKDDPNLPAANYHFKNYYIYKPEDLDKYETEIKQLCDLLNFRAYISVNVKDLKQVTLDTCAEYARRIAVHDFKKPYSIFESCSGKNFIVGEKKYVLDIDNISEKPEGYLEKVIEIIDTKCQNQTRKKERIKFSLTPKKESTFRNLLGWNKYIEYTGNDNDWVYDNVITTIPTKTGAHIISYGFDRIEFEEQMKSLFPDIEIPDIKVNHLTLLYENIC